VQLIAFSVIKEALKGAMRETHHTILNTESQLVLDVWALD